MGIRHGEKLCETFLTNEKCAHAFDLEDFYRVPCDKRNLNYEKYFVSGNTERKTMTEFNSNNTKLLNKEEVKENLLGLPYIQKRVGKIEETSMKFLVLVLNSVADILTS